VSSSDGLTPEQVRLFRHNGFLKLDGQLPAELVARLRQGIGAEVEAETEPVVRDESGRVVRLSQVFDRRPEFREAATHGSVLDPLEDLLGPNIEIVRNRHNHATLNVASKRSDTFHRDNVQWTQGLLTVIHYLEETNLDNGCTQVIPGTHFLPAAGVLHRLDEQPWFAESGIMGQAVPVPMPAGGLLAIDSLILHRIGPNHTAGTRTSMTIGYRSVDELAGEPDPKTGKTELVRGERIYQGNDGGR
jgi:ectoine hydroxylase-related dioxygenase (phytanoyl-CoA dioxygenase family)